MITPCRRFVVAFLPMAFLILAGCGVSNFNNRFTAQEVVTKSFKTVAPPHVVVETFNGGIDIVTADAGKVEAKVTKRAGGKTQDDADDDLDNIDVRMTQEGDTIKIVATQTAQKAFANRGASVELEVPTGTVLELHTNNGKVTSTGLVGNTTAHSSNGAMQIKGCRGELHLTTSNGPINVEEGLGVIDAKTTNGQIHIKAKKASVTARTSNGGIHFKGDLAAGDQTFESSNGSITVALPPDVGFVLEADTSHGKVKSGFPIKTTESSKNKNRLHGTVGKDPATRLKLHSSNGSIEIQQEK